jgi:hypothetical protein
MPGFVISAGLRFNFYKRIKADNNNVMLAAAATNFKRMMNNWELNPL